MGTMSVVKYSMDPNSPLIMVPMDFLSCYHIGRSSGLCGFFKTSNRI